VAVRGIVGVSRFVEIQEVHKKKRRLTGRWPSDLRKEALSVAPLGYDLRRHASMFTDARWHTVVSWRGHWPSRHTRGAGVTLTCRRCGGSSIGAGTCGGHTPTVILSPTSAIEVEIERGSCKPVPDVWMLNLEAVHPSPPERPGR
jgi:hypothetical protein